MPDTKKIWAQLSQEAEDFTKTEAHLANFLERTVLQHQTLMSATAAWVAHLLNHPSLPSQLFHKWQTPEIENQIATDLDAIYERDPACNHLLQAFLNFKGFKALTTYRFAHAAWGQGQKMTALILQGMVCDLWDVDIHPAASIGCGVMMDHASAIIIGETAVIENDVSMLHGVTLGGKGMFPGDRHPKVRRGVFIGAGATILGNIEIGEYATIAAGSIVLKDIPANTIAAGAPARIIRKKPASAVDEKAG